MIRFSFIGCSVLSLVIVFTSKAVFAEPTLRDAAITFYTHDDDKDDDTKVSVKIEKGNVTVAKAEHFADKTKFPDGNGKKGIKAGPYSLTVSETIPKSQVAQTKTSIHIDPNGHDTWIFNYVITLTFSDNTTQELKVDNIRLSEKERDGSWNN